MAVEPKIPDAFAAAMKVAGEVFDGAELKLYVTAAASSDIAQILRAWAEQVQVIVREARQNRVPIQIPELARRSGVGQNVMRGHYGPVRSFVRYFAFYLTKYNNCPARLTGEMEIVVDVAKAIDKGALF